MEKLLSSNSLDGEVREYSDGFVEKPPVYTGYSVEEEDEEEEEDEDDYLDEDEDEDEEKKKPGMSLEKYNELTGKKYKSWDDVAKAEKERDKQFAKAGQKKEKKEVAPQNQPGNEDLEEIFLQTNEAARTVWDEVKEAAKTAQMSPIQMFKKSTYFQNEGKARAEAEKQRTENEKKINSPSGKLSGTGKKLKPEDVKPETIQHWLKTGQHDKIEKFGEMMEKRGA